MNQKSFKINVNQHLFIVTLKITPRTVEKDAINSKLGGLQQLRKIKIKTVLMDYIIIVLYMSFEDTT